MKKLFTIKNFVLLVIILVMANNIEHLSWVHQLIARKWFSASVYHSIAVVIIIELAIIVMVKKGEMFFAFLFASCIFLLSLIYYPVGDFYQAKEWGKLLGSVVYSYMFSFSIYHFAVIQSRENEAAEISDQTQAELHKSKQQVKELSETLQQTSANMAQIKAKLADFETLQNDINKERTCPKCGVLFESANSRRSHQGRCKGKNKSLKN